MGVQEDVISALLVTLESLEDNEIIRDSVLRVTPRLELEEVRTPAHLPFRR